MGGDITVVQIAEIESILKSYLPLREALKVGELLLLARNVMAFGVMKRDCLEALRISREIKVGFSDAIAYVIMRNNGVDEIYSFDSDFDKLGVRRVVG